MNKQDLKEGQEVYVKGKVIHTGDHLDIVLANGSFIENAIVLHHKKPVVPQFVADWYEKNKNSLEFNIFDYVYRFDKKEESDLKKWFNGINTNPFQTLVNMHQFGYEVEEEKRYLIKVVGMDRINGYLIYNKDIDKWSFGMSNESKTYRTKHTRKGLEDAGFGEVFNSPLFEVEDVNE
jgi:gp178|nr:MAG TPA: Protein of unknown function (DUF1642) [Caudoviricetes sp.]